MATKKKIQYPFTATSSRITQEKAELYGPILDELYEKKGELHPADVVEVAKDPKNPLHPEFTWDNDQAGAAFRLVQARKLIQEIVITVIRRPRQEPVQIRLFHSVRNPQGQRFYGRLDVLNGDEHYRKQLEAQALKAILYWQERLKAYRALPEIVAALASLNLKGKLEEVERVKPAAALVAAAGMN